MKPNTIFLFLTLLSVFLLSGCTGSKVVQDKFPVIEEDITIEAANKISIVDAHGISDFEVDPENLIYRSKNTEDSVYYMNSQTNQIVEKAFFPREEERMVSNVIFPEKTKILQLISIGRDKYIVCMQEKQTGEDISAGVVEDSDFIIALLENDSLKPLFRRYDMQEASAGVDFRYDISGDYIVMAPYENRLLIYDILSEKIVKTISVIDSQIRNPSVYDNIVTYTVAKTTDIKNEATSVFSYDILKDETPQLIDVNSVFPFVYKNMIFYSQLTDTSKPGDRKYTLVMREMTGGKKVLATGLINPVWGVDFQSSFVNFHSNSSRLNNSVYDYSGNPLGSLAGFSIGSNIELIYDRQDDTKQRDRMLKFIPKRIVIEQ